MKIKLILLCSALVFAIFSCTSDDSGSSDNPETSENPDNPDTPDTPDPTPSTTETFDLTIDNENLSVTSWQATRTYDNIDITGNVSDGRTFYIRFNENGVLDRAEFTPDPNAFSYSSSYYFPKKTFQIENLSIDEANKFVKISCKGIIYEDDFDVFSPSSTLSVDKGEINIKFKENPNAPSSNLDTFIDTKIDGKLFESMKHVTSGVSNVISYSGESDGKESFFITFNKTNTAPGTYNFTSSSSELLVGFSTNDPFVDEFGEYTEYETSGTLTIESFTPAAAGTFGFMKGTFELSATEGTTTISVTEGKFNISFL